MKGEKNPNFRNKARATPEICDRMRAAYQRRGQGWSQEDQRHHAEHMRGPANKMRGKRHTPTSLQRMSQAKRAQYAAGTVRMPAYRVSTAEREIINKLRRLGYQVEEQYHIHGVPFVYDIHIIGSNVLIEYNGDYWHANPVKYKPEATVKFRRSLNVPVERIWARDAEKVRMAEEYGFRVLTVWESDYQAAGFESVVSALWTMTRERTPMVEEVKLVELPR